SMNWRPMGLTSPRSKPAPAPTTGSSATTCAASWCCSPAIRSCAKWCAGSCKAGPVRPRRASTASGAPESSPVTRRKTPACAARFTLPISGGTCCNQQAALQIVQQDIRGLLQGRIEGAGLFPQGDQLQGEAGQDAEPLEAP